MNEKLKALQDHEAECAICQAAKKRVNNFCAEGQLLFVEYSQTTLPTSVETRRITEDEYSQLVQAQDRARRSGRDN